MSVLRMRSSRPDAQAHRTATGRRNDAVPPGQLAAAADAAVRSLVNRYELASGHRVPSSIAVVGSLVGDGVTSTAQALARVLATDFGAEVCLVDVSAGTPPGVRDASAAAARRDNGIYEVLTGVLPIEAVLQPTDHPTVRYLSVGNATPDQVHAMARWSELELLVKRLGDDFDFLVWDTPSVHANSGALAPLRHAEAYLLVARWGRTTASQLRETTEELASLPAIGAVLNGYRSRTPRIVRRLLDG
ncbi:MAG: hypothetical protein JJE52_06940 [Acidimicrobiia bacterium]|nr:hypothetical protein [Acidimicrobiia bacterium]